MNFTDPDFLLLLPVFMLVYAASQGRFRMAWLLLCSYLFYAWGSPWACILLFISSLVDYMLGRWMADGAPQGRKKYIIMSLVFNLGLLGICKYSSFVWNDVLTVPASWLGWSLPVMAATIPPVGISFFTFQTMSYTIDVYRGSIPACRSPLRFFTYVSMFPQLVAGPIVRAVDLLPQLEGDVALRREAMLEGLRRFAVGFVKKACIADSLAVMLVDQCFANPEKFPPEMRLLAMLAYGFQIYFDFSGYSDMAIGLGKMTGYDFPENFNLPYLSRSFSEFWTRWHISLSSWLRDYLYISLGGNRMGVARTMANLLFTMLLGGLWHGASWMFLLWGALHGLLLVLQRVWGALVPARAREWIPAPLQILVVWFAVHLCWVPFRAGNMETVLSFWRAPLEINWLQMPAYLWSLSWEHQLLLSMCFFSHFFMRRVGAWLNYQAWPMELKAVALASALFWCLHFYTDAGKAFIYFQF